MKIFWGVCSFLLLNQFALAQTLSQNDSSQTSNHVHITFDLLRAFQGSLQVNCEKPVTRKASVCFGLIGTWAQSGGMGSLYLKAQDFQMAASNGVILDRVDKTQLKGAGINVKYKIYLGKKPIVMQGLWFGPELFYRQLSVKGQYNDFEGRKIAQKTLFLIYAGYALGWQKMILNVLCLDAYFGGGFFYSKYAGDTFPTKDRRNFQLDYTGVYLNGSIAIGFAK